MLRGRIEISTQYDPGARGFPLYVWQTERSVSGEIVSVATQMVMEQVDINAAPLPIAYMSRESMERLMDELWNAGIRPTNVRNQSEIIDAKEKHIADLRKVYEDSQGTVDALLNKLGGNVN